MVTAAQLEVVSSALVNHAMGHNGIGFVQRIVLAAGSEPLTDLQLSADLVDSAGAILTRPWQHHLDALDAGGCVVLDNPPVRLDPAAISTVEEPTHAELRVTVTASGMPVAHLGAPVRVLAARQWLLEPTAAVLSLELLAAFVQPTHPAVAGVLGEVASALEKATRSVSLAVSHVSPCLLYASRCV